MSIHTERVWTIPVELTAGHEDDAAALLRSYYASVGSDGGPAYTGTMFERLNGGGDRPEVADHVPRHAPPERARLGRTAKLRDRAC